MTSRDELSGSDPYQQSTDAVIAEAQAGPPAISAWSEGDGRPLASPKIGMTGFEPAAPSSRTKCATKLRYIPLDATLEDHPPNDSVLADEEPPKPQVPNRVSADPPA
jgi:hypothetical protein